jgi:hypothetical protein
LSHTVQANFLPEALWHGLSEGLLIVGWASMWQPASLLIYEWWPAWRAKQV